MNSKELEESGVIKPIICERYADNGQLSHYDVVDPATGDVLWEPEEGKPITSEPLLKELGLSDAELYSMAQDKLAATFSSYWVEVVQGLLMQLRDCLLPHLVEKHGAGINDGLFKGEASREYRFHDLTIKSGDWVYGYYCYDDEMGCDIIYTRIRPLKGYKQKQFEIKVKKGTVSMYSGLPEKQKEVKPGRYCPECKTLTMIMFDADSDMCTKCEKTFNGKL